VRVVDQKIRRRFSEREATPCQCSEITANENSELEFKPSAELKNSGIARRSNLSERGAVDARQLRVVEEVHVIEQIERFGPELDAN
jgi:hypothetical protein